jgi:hypothetical protein
MSAFAESADFSALLDADRYAARSSAFDRHVQAAHRRHWDPQDPLHIDFSQPFDTGTQSILPFDLVPELGSAVADRIGPSRHTHFANETARWWLSGILHGEQAALSLACSLANCLHDAGTVEYVTTQAQEEARHVHAFTRYIAARWQRPFRATPALSGLLEEMVEARHVPTKIVGMQLVVEGMAMGLLATLHRRTADPLLHRLTELVMADEAQHHRVGKTWVEDDLSAIDETSRHALEDWALRCFRVLVENMNHPKEKAELYADFGIEWEWAARALREAYGTQALRDQVRQAHRVFHPLVTSLLEAGLITRRTRHFYALWFDLDALTEVS